MINPTQIQDYEQATQDDPELAKNWNFPKNHARQHIFDDVESKGVTKNYVTTYNENLHGPLKKYYLNRTNFKNVAGQVSICIPTSRRCSQIPDSKSRSSPTHLHSYPLSNR